MRKYCKAYHLRDLRRFAEWTEEPADNGPLADESVVYLWDDYTVARSPIHHDWVVFASVTPQWQDFCTQTLQFHIPTDLQLAAAESKNAAATYP